MDPFANALTDAEQLGELYEPANDNAWRKDVGRLDAAARALIAVSPLVVMSTSAR